MCACTNETILSEDGTCRELVRFGYNDFKMRLGHRA